LLRKDLPRYYLSLWVGVVEGLWRNHCRINGGWQCSCQPENHVFDPGYPLPALIANNYGEMLSIPMFDSALMFAALLLMAIVVSFLIHSRGGPSSILRENNKDICYDVVEKM
jgi:hypothetical protein